jgi:hypothetical protein
MLYKSDLISEFGADDRKRQHLEDDLQAAVCTLLKWALPADATFWAVPNGGLRHKQEAARMSRLGLRAGCPDLHIVYRGRLHCLELKAPKGQLSATQAQMISKLEACGVPTAVIRELSDVTHIMREWNIPLSARLS